MTIANDDELCSCGARPCCFVAALRRTIESEAKAALYGALQAIYRPAVATKRKHHVEGLSAFARYLEIVDADIGNAADEIRKLAFALRDLDDGIVHPALLATRFSRPPDRSDVWAARIEAAIGIEALRHAGTPVDQGIRDAAVAYPGLVGLLRPRTDPERLLRPKAKESKTKSRSILETSLKSWRRTLETERKAIETAERKVAKGTKMTPEEQRLIDDRLARVTGYVDGLRIINHFANNNEDWKREGLRRLDRAQRMAMELSPTRSKGGS